VYDDPGFIVHNIWRHYGGWYDQNPAHLRIGNEKQVAAEFCALAGGPTKLAQRARELAHEGSILTSTRKKKEKEKEKEKEKTLTYLGKYDAASHMIEHAVLISPESSLIHKHRVFIYRTRAEQETSLMAKGIYSSAQMESEKFLKTKVYMHQRWLSFAVGVVNRFDMGYEGAVFRRYYSITLWLSFLSPE